MCWNKAKTLFSCLWLFETSPFYWVSVVTCAVYSGKVVHPEEIEGLATKFCYTKVLKQFVSLATYTQGTTEPFYKIPGQLDRALGLLKMVAEGFGAKNFTVAKKSGMNTPVLYFKLPGRAGKQQVLFYNHFDTMYPSDKQVASNFEKQKDAVSWDVQDGDADSKGPEDTSFIGRGATDDKGPLLCVLLGAFLATKSSGNTAHFVFEFEEEVGSLSLKAGLEELAAEGLLPAGDQIEFAVISDTLWKDAAAPTTIYSLKGMFGMQ
ncbi:unnamed protein product, partial [Polarella glacialis]